MSEALVRPEVGSPWLEWALSLTVAFSLISIPASAVMLAVACVATLVERLRRHDLAIPWPPIWAPLALYVLTTLLAVALSPEPSLGWGTVRKLVLLTIVFVATVALRTPQAVYRTFAVVTTAGVLSALVGFWQFFHGYDPFASLHRHLPVDPSRPVRVTGFMSHWMTFSGQLLMVALIATAFALFGDKRHRRLWEFGALLSIVGVALSLTRSAWLALFLGLLLLFWVKKPRLLWVYLILLLLAWPLAPEVFKQRVEELSNPLYGPRVTRLDALWVGMNIMRSHPFLGVGPGRMDRVFWEFHPDPQSVDHATMYTGHLHNNLLQLAAERGVPCAIAFLWLVAMVVQAAWRGLAHWRSDPIRAPAEAAALSGVVAFFIAGMFEFNFGDSEVLSLMLLLCVTPYLVAEPPPPAERGLLKFLAGRLRGKPGTTS